MLSLNFMLDNYITKNNKYKILKRTIFLITFYLSYETHTPHTKKASMFFLETSSLNYIK